MSHHPPGAGRSSFDLIDPDRFFALLQLKEGMTVVDVGCGRGNYALAMSGRVGKEGRIYACDLWAEGARVLSDMLVQKRINNVIVLVTDVSKSIAAPDASADICLMATVFHDLVHDGKHEGALKQTARILKPGGRLAVLEFKKIEGPPGPPIHARLSPDDLQDMLQAQGFNMASTFGVGPHLYLSMFTH